MSSCFVALWLHHLLLFLSPLANASRRGKQHHHHHQEQEQQQQRHLFVRKSFQWKASLHTRTGVASSHEESIFKAYHNHQHPAAPTVGHRRKKHNHDYDSETLSSSIKRHCQQSKASERYEFAHKIFSTYPKFLERPLLTAGLCRVTVSPPSSSQPSSSSISISSLECRLLQLFKLPPALLIFGKPRCCSCSRRTIPLLLHTQTQSNNLSADVMEKYDGPSSTIPNPKEEMICCIEIPIVGGLLAHVDTPTLDMTTTTTTPKSSANERTPSKRSTKDPVVENGYLRFTWIETQCRTNQWKSHRHQQQQQQQKISQPEIHIITQIGGHYRPTLAGPTLPIPKWRNSIYCSTQRIFHAYVMYRFHGYVMNEYSTTMFGRRDGQRTVVPTTDNTDTGWWAPEQHHDIEEYKYLLIDN